MKSTIPFVPVLAALIRNEKGEFLIAQRKTSMSNGGKWEFPGGKLLISETPEECLAREIKEELGLDIIVLNPLKLVNETYPERSILLIGYLCSYQGGQLKLRDHDQAAWVEPHLLLNYNLSEPDKPIAEKLDEIYTIRSNEI